MRVIRHGGGVFAKGNAVRLLMRKRISGCRVAHPDRLDSKGVKRDGSMACFNLVSRSSYRARFGYFASLVPCKAHAELLRVFSQKVWA
jgi:hypothetical protein